MQTPNLKVGQHVTYEKTNVAWVKDRFNTPTVTLSRTSFKRWQITTRNCPRSLHRASFTNETLAMQCVHAVLGVHFRAVLGAHYRR